MNESEQLRSQGDPGWGTAPTSGEEHVNEHLAVAPAPGSKSAAFADGAWWLAFDRAEADTELERLFDEFHERLVRYCSTLTHDMSAAERLARTVFVRAAKETEGESRTASWLWETARTLQDETFLRENGVQP
ncbi:hypothetical protein [Streptomyces microflavus]|uniref:hypothetical protein n=1 Tax=Streptomyces microflavus TaxID=1919 RepID=UPI0036620608